ncbi:integral membrane protein [Histoplasma capsulatum var. duboisii H88]|uniref:Integral membrane protein n=1 Tax=Ajellomyces capsulatus (strain H88) TaxID=544711 RepID=A0A8A1LI82_AJEC8|nr:integral membrane protein [Histoplasma capsulatum var. duboisii H88]
MVIWTPNTSRFAGNLHSRIMQSFPFLVEMFCWIVTYFFYRVTKLVSQKVFSKTGIWDVALQNGFRVLEIE